MRVRADDIDLLIYRLAVGLDAQFHGHAEQVEVLVDFADGAEALVVAEPVDRVLVGELGRAGAVDPLREERRELLLALRLGHLCEIGGADALVGVLAQRALERGQKGLVADLPAQHVEDHGALFEGHGLELGREGAEPAGAGERNGVVGQGSGGHVLQAGVHGALAVLFLHVHQLAVAGHAVGDPGIVERARADSRSPTTGGRWCWPAGGCRTCRRRASPSCRPVPDAQTAGSVSSGISTTLRCGDSSAPKLSVKKSNSLVAVWASSLAACWWATVR